MKSINLSVCKNKWFNILLFLVLFQMAVMGTNKASPAPNSLAWQMEELMNWLIKTRNLVPEKDAAGQPFYVIKSLDLNGSVEKNRFTFHMIGHVDSKQPVLVPLFGSPDGVMLKNVTLNGQPAVVGFEDKDFYFVRTKETDFVIKGDISLVNQLRFTVPGPVNLFSADLSDGRVVEGNFLPGVKQAALHLKSGVKDQKIEADVKPLFQIARAVRIQKEVTFEYGVTVRSGKEISRVVLPMTFGEIVLEVPGVKGWKMENKNLVVPASGRSVSFTVTGRLPEAGVFKTDKRSNYEWWLIESDAEHRVTVDTSGKPVDASKSPLKKKLSSSRLFLLSRGQEIAVTVNPLKTLDAMAIVIRSQFRKTVWTKNGDLVAEDRVFYDNNGVDYISFDCKGKPVFFAENDEPKAILSDNPDKENQVLVPLKKGKHSFLVQSIGNAKPSFFGGLLEIPMASHHFTVSRSSARIGVPSRIIPIWFWGGDRVDGPFNWQNAVVILITVGFILLFFKGYLLRTAAIISFLGLYLLFPRLYIVLGFCVIALGAAFYLRKILKRWMQWIVFACLLMASVWFIFYVSSLNEAAKMYYNLTSSSSPSGCGGLSTIFADLNIPDQELFERKHGGEFFSGTFYDEEESSSDTMEENTRRGVIPVYLPIPEFIHSMTITRELVKKDQSVHFTLLYITWTTLIPMIIFWLLCWGYVGFCRRRDISKGIESIKKTMNKT